MALLYKKVNNKTVIGASLSEPHINGIAMHEFYIIYYYYGTSVTRNIICPAWFYGHKREIFYCAFSCLGYRPYIRHSNLANCKFTLVLVFEQYRREERARQPRSARTS